jgi:hypothetical protein
MKWTGSLLLSILLHSLDNTFQAADGCSVARAAIRVKKAMIYSSRARGESESTREESTSKSKGCQPLTRAIAQWLLRMCVRTTRRQARARIAHAHAYWKPAAKVCADDSKRECGCPSAGNGTILALFNIFPFMIM